MSSVRMTTTTPRSMTSNKRTDHSSHPAGARHICDLSTSAYLRIRQHTSAYVLQFPPSGARRIYDLSSSGWCKHADSISASVFVLLYARASASVFVPATSTSQCGRHVERRMVWSLPVEKSAVRHMVQTSTVRASVRTVVP